MGLCCHETGVYIVTGFLFFKTTYNQKIHNSLIISFSSI